MPNIGPSCAVDGCAAAMRTHSSGSLSSRAAGSLAAPSTSTGCPAETPSRAISFAFIHALGGCASGVLRSATDRRTSGSAK